MILDPSQRSRQEVGYKPHLVTWAGPWSVNTVPGTHRSCWGWPPEGASSTHSLWFLLKKKKKIQKTPPLFRTRSAGLLCILHTGASLRGAALFCVNKQRRRTANRRCSGLNPDLNVWKGATDMNLTERMNKPSASYRQPCPPSPCRPDSGSHRSLLPQLARCLLL